MLFKLSYKSSVSGSSYACKTQEMVDSGKRTKARVNCLNLIFPVFAVMISLEATNSLTAIFRCDMRS